VPERVARVLRATLFIVVVSAVLLVAWGYRVRAQLTERMIDTGSAMLQYEDVERQDARRTLVFNGQQIHLSSGTTRHELGQVLDYYEQHCLDHDGGLIDELDTFAADHPEVRLNTEMMDPIIRSERGDRGVVACLYMEETGGAEAFMERYRRYQDSGDLSEVGDMRYIYAEEADRGTHFVAFWTDGPFVLREMLPADGDAPGQDMDDVARPDEVRRFLSVRESGAPQRMTVYLADRNGPTEMELERFYREDLSRRGWGILDPAGDSDLAPDVRVFAAERDDRMATFILSTNDEGRAVATILEAR